MGKNAKQRSCNNYVAHECERFLGRTFVSEEIPQLGEQQSHGSAVEQPATRPKIQSNVISHESVISAKRGVGLGRSPRSDSGLIQPGRLYHLGRIATANAKRRPRPTSMLQQKNYSHFISGDGSALAQQLTQIVLRVASSQQLRTAPVTSL